MLDLLEGVALRVMSHMDEIESDAMRVQGIKGTFPGPIENQYETLGALFFIGFVLVFDRRCRRPDAGRRRRGRTRSRKRTQAVYSGFY